jgi:uncharacterized repeat protein (TIGR03803 family)
MQRIYFICLFLCLTTLAARPAQAQTETVLYSFCSALSCADGIYPKSSLTSYGGNYYGTTYTGGVNGEGTVFELSPNGSGGWNETVLYNFSEGTDGANPLASVIFDSVGNLYGTMPHGGAYGYGVVFELSPVGASWTETVLYNFCSQADCADGEYPVNTLIMDPAGNLYGVTNQGGSTGAGTVFELSPAGGNWTEQVLYSPGSTTGYGINAGLTMDAAGNIFGATWSTVFELSPNGKGAWNPTVIHIFDGGAKDGMGAAGTPVLDKDGNLYGTTIYGATKNLGTVYKLSPVTKGKKKGTWTVKILHSFKGGLKDGYYPVAGIVFDAAGDIYGTTEYGGKYSDGAVFELVANGKGSYKEKVLWSFNGTDGGYPYDSPILDSSGNLYGTTYDGGSHGAGVVYEVTP